MWHIKMMNHMRLILTLYLLFISMAFSQSSIYVFEPNGGEDWKVGSQHTIQWLATNGPNRVNIEYSIDGGTNWAFIATNIVSPVNGNAQYNWTIPDEPSQDCFVKVSDAVDGDPFDVNDAPFTISRVPGLDIIQPNGGETWQVGSVQLVRWSTVVRNDPANIKIELSVDGGNNWMVIEASTPNTEEYSWTIPDMPSINCLMAISDVTDGVPSDTSDNFFIIYPAPELTLVSPNGGESWVVGSSHAIEWQSVLPGIPANVKLEYSVDGGNNWLQIVSSTANDGSHTWTIPDSPSSNCLVRISDATNAGLSDVSDNEFTIQSAAALEVTGPVSGESFAIGDVIQITWNSSGAVGNVKIDLTRNDGNSWETLFSNTANDGSQNWTVEPPRSSRCRVRIQAVQNPSVQSISPQFSISAPVVSILANDEVQPSGDQQTAYRLISVPLRLDNSSAEDVLVDDLGGYNDEIWRFFDYQNGNYSEFPNVRNFTPGRSYFLIVRDANKIVDAGPGELVADSVVTVPLTAGWNFIANPFIIDIPVSALSISDNLITYEGSWSTPGDITVLHPWKGYALRVDAPTTLAIRYPGLTGMNFSRKSAGVQEEWQIQIRAKCQEAKDNGNFAGIKAGASQEWDRCDYYEPPPIGEYVMVYFPHRDWKIHPDLYTGDFRETGKAGYQWDFEIQTPIQDVIELKFDGITSVPDEFNVILIDPSLNMAQNLRENPNYSMFNHRKLQVQQLSLLVGSDDYIRDSLMGKTLDISGFELLNNYPNPFNMSTTIAFTLPVREKVTLQVFNSLGEEVATLIDGTEYDTGLYRVYWNGRDSHGRVAASGIYIYRLFAGSHSMSKKMLLIK